MSSIVYQHDKLLPFSRRPACTRSLVLVLVLLLVLPPASRILPRQSNSVNPFAASAQSVCNGGKGSLIQNPCASAGSAFNVLQFESEGVQAWLALHGMPASDSTVIYDHGRTDLRTELRAFLFQTLVGIIRKPPTSRTAHEQVIYTWFQGLAQKQEIALFQSALDDANNWKNDPCHWKPDPYVAAVYGLTYDGTPYCNASSLSQAFRVGIPWPGFNYFYSAALKNTYEAPLNSAPGGTSIILGAQTDYALVYGVTATSAAAGGAISGTVLGSLLQFLTPYALNLVTAAGQTASAGAEALAAAATAEAGFSAGPAVIIGIALLIGKQAAFQVYQNQQATNAFAQLQASLTYAHQKPPDMQSFLQCPEGPFKANLIFLNATLPDYPSLGVLPRHRPGTDIGFLVKNGTATAGQESISYKDFGNVTWTVTPWTGWFIQTATAKGVPVSTITPTLHITGWDGAKWIVTRSGNNFILSKTTPATKDQVCPANYLGVTPKVTTDCSSYVASSFPMVDANGDRITVSLSLPPTIPDQSFFFPELTFTNTEVKVTGFPRPTVSIISSAPDFLRSSGASLIGFPGNDAGSYQVTLKATNVAGSATRTVTVYSGTAISIASLNRMTVPNDASASFNVLTTGKPAPALSISGYVPVGLTFNDNGNGTATIHGTWNASRDRCNSLSAQFLPRGTCSTVITATNGGQTANQTFTWNQVYEPSPFVTSPTTYTFPAGVPSSQLFTTRGAVTPVTIRSVQLPLPSWLTLKDFGDGTASLSGTAPVASSPVAPAVSLLSAEAASQKPVYSSWVITFNVDQTLRFSSPNTASFVTGVAGSFEATVNRPFGFTGVTYTGSLPQGLSSNVTLITPSISGIPAAGSGGSYPITVSWEDGTGPALTSNVRLDVLEPPSFTSAPSAIFQSGVASSYSIRTAGYPITKAGINCGSIQCYDMTFSLSGALPKGLTFSSKSSAGNETGIGVISGTPAAGTQGVYRFTVTADNGIAPGGTGSYKAPQNFTLIVR